MATIKIEMIETITAVYEIETDEIETNEPTTAGELWRLWQFDATASGELADHLATGRMPVDMAVTGREIRVLED